MKVLDDNRIIELYLQREESAISETAEKYGNRLRALSYSITCDIQTAEECENDTYMQAWNLIPPNEPRSYLYAFLARITRHVSISICRNRSRLKRSAFICELSNELEECIPAYYDIERKLDEMVFAEILNSFLAVLDDEKRNIFLRRYWYLDSIADISKRFGVSESKVKTSLYRCRKHLRKHLEKEGYTL